VPFDPSVPVVPLFVDGHRVGTIAHHLLPKLVEAAGGQIKGSTDLATIELGPGGPSADSLDRLAARLASAGLTPPATGERCALSDLDTGAALGSLERTATIALGIPTLGVHLNAFDLEALPEPAVWLARRSASARSFPRSWDNLVAGCVPAFLTPRAALCREGAEEAGLTPDLLGAAELVGVIPYRRVTNEGFVDVSMWVYDLELKTPFEPANHDGSIEKFVLAPWSAAARLAASSSFKPNSGLVMQHFLTRMNAGSDRRARGTECSEDTTECSNSGRG
jgi:8-oxo-dGTP pyrophosphatase MutT (NUDIX family)